MATTQKNKLRECSFCSSIEGNPRFEGRFIVDLTEVNHKGKIMLACQTCKENHIHLKPENLTITHSNSLGYLSKLKDMGF